MTDDGTIGGAQNIKLKTKDPKEGKEEKKKGMASRALKGIGFGGTS